MENIKLMHKHTVTSRATSRMQRAGMRKVKPRVLANDLPTLDLQVKQETSQSSGHICRHKTCCSVFAHVANVTWWTSTQQIQTKLLDGQANEYCDYLVPLIQAAV